MRRFLCFTLLLLAASFAAAQTTIPGTFNAAPSQNVMPTASYVVTPPFLTLGNGLKPSIITNSLDHVVATTNVENPVPTYATGFSAETREDAEEDANVANGDFVVRGAGYGRGRTESRSLGEISRTYRSNRPTNIRTYTNDDIQKMNDKMMQSVPQLNNK